MAARKKGGKPGPVKKSRPGTGGSEVLLGFHSVYEALGAGRRQFECIFLSSKRQDPRVEKVEKLARQKGIEVQAISPEGLEKLANGSLHQGIGARVSPFPIKDAGQIWAELKDRKAPFFILVAESIEDPHNLGALIRTALCAGVDHILVPRDRSALPSPGVSRSSAGAMEHADIYQVTNVAAMLRDLKQEGAWVSGLDAHGDKALFQADFKGDLVLVVGGEHKGLRPGVKKECDFIVSIPITGKVNSLNASVAGGVAMFEALRQRTS